MNETHEDPEENPAGAGGRSESGPDPDSTGSPESASDPRTVAEQSAPFLATLLATRPPERKALKRFLSPLFDDPDVVDAVIQEIEVLAAERVQISISMLASVLLKRLDAQDAKLDAQAAKLDAQAARLDAQAARLDKQGDQIGELKGEIGELKGETRALTESIASLRRENRFMMILFAALIALGVFGWLGESCSRPVESNAGVEASQAGGGSGRDMRTLPAETREPSTESSETDGPAEDDEPTEDDGERSVSDPGNGR